MLKQQWLKSIHNRGWKRNNLKARLKMKLVSYTTKKKDRLGIYVDGKIFNLQECAAGLGFELPNRMRRFLRGGDEYMNIARQVEQAIKEGKISSFIDDPNLKLLAPIPSLSQHQ